MTGKYGMSLVLGFSAVALAAMTGCYAEADTQPVAYAEVTSAPVGIETAPSVVYEGQPVYLYTDRWYYRHGNSWAYYRHEPPELYRHRTVIHQAPARPAYVHQEPVREAPPARREYEHPREAPPAERVR